MQIATWINAKKRNLVLISESQKQLKSVVCNVYAVARIFHLLSKVNLSAKRTSEDQIKEHLSVDLS